MDGRSVECGLVAPAASTLAMRDHGALYADALKGYMGDPSEGLLRRAYEIGRRAIAQGKGVLEMGTMHHEALAKILRRSSGSGSLEEELRRAGEFLAESLSPYEMAHRGYQEAVPALRQLNETLEREIQRIAHDVHDEAGPLLDAARLAMSAAAHDLSPDLQERFREIGAILDQAETELRRLAHELRPMILDELGLVPALQFLADRVSKRARLAVRLESSLEGRQPALVETALYRIVQEALANVIRHSGASNVKIELSSDARTKLRCVVRDDGVGFDQAVLSGKGNSGLGLVGIRERLKAIRGTLQIRSEPGRGTELLAEIP
jgi:two-component system, NarL family, sensor histidine kinase UhpB